MGSPTADLLQHIGFSIVQANSQRNYCPPSSREGPPPQNGCDQSEFYKLRIFLGICFFCFCFCCPCRALFVHLLCFVIGNIVDLGPLFCTCLLLFICFVIGNIVDLGPLFCTCLFLFIFFVIGNIVDLGPLFCTCLFLFICFVIGNIVDLGPLFCTCLFLFICFVIGNIVDLGPLFCTCLLLFIFLIFLFLSTCNNKLVFSLANLYFNLIS